MAAPNFLNQNFSDDEDEDDDFNPVPTAESDDDGDAEVDKDEKPQPSRRPGEVPRHAASNKDGVDRLNGNGSLGKDDDEADEDPGEDDEGEGEDLGDEDEGDEEDEDDDDEAISGRPRKRRRRGGLNPFMKFISKSFHCRHHTCADLASVCRTSETVLHLATSVKNVVGSSCPSAITLRRTKSLATSNFFLRSAIPANCRTRIFKHARFD